jgi:hypothetical protein
MEAQRSVLEVVNKNRIQREELCGLSKKAIERWIHANQIDPTDKMLRILMNISDKLFFLANKSQEQVSEEYKTISVEISALRNDLKKIMG